MALACNTAAVIVSLDTSVRPAVVALPAQVVTLEALLHTPDKAAQPDAGGKGAQVRWEGAVCRWFAEYCPVLWGRLI